MRSEGGNTLFYVSFIFIDDFEEGLFDKATKRLKHVGFIFSRTVFCSKKTQRILQIGYHLLYFGKT